LISPTLVVRYPVACFLAMAALSRSLSALALIAGSAVGARIAKRRRTGGAKFIAGVPVLNYAEVSPSEFGADEEWVVMVKPDTTDAQIEQMCRIAKNGCKLAGKPDHGGVPFFEMRGAESDLEAVIKSGDGAVNFVEFDQTVYAIPELAAEDEESSLWGLERVGAYQRDSTGSGVAVFVLDTGVRPSHRDFGGRVVPTLDVTDYSLVECNGASDCAADNQGHGTHCAGTAAGTSYGVAPAATVRSVKVLSDSGSGQWSWIYSALDWLARSSIRPAVASMSLGGPGNKQAMRNALDSATNAGLSVVVAAGNDNADACSFSPAFALSAITVGSTDSQDRRSDFSNYGMCTNIWAPGSSILSAGHSSDTATATKSGTSMACPHVSGGAALVLQKNPGFNYAQVLSTLQANAIDGAISDLKDLDTNKLLFIGGEIAPGPSPAPTPAPTTTTLPAGCRDNNSNCPFWADMGMCDMDWLREQCCASCWGQ